MDGFLTSPGRGRASADPRRQSEWWCSTPRRSSKRSAPVLGIRIRVLCVMLTGSGSCDPERAGARGGVSTAGSGTCSSWQRWGRKPRLTRAGSSEQS